MFKYKSGITDTGSWQSCGSSANVPFLRRSSWGSSPSSVPVHTGSQPLWAPEPLSSLLRFCRSHQSASYKPRIPLQQQTKEHSETLVQQRHTSCEVMMLYLPPSGWQRPRPRHEDSWGRWSTLQHRQRRSWRSPVCILQSLSCRSLCIWWTKQDLIYLNVSSIWSDNQ